MVKGRAISSSLYGYFSVFSKWSTMNLFCFFSSEKSKNLSLQKKKKMNEWVFGSLETECHINESKIRVSLWAALKTRLIILHAGGCSLEGLALSPGWSAVRDRPLLAGEGRGGRAAAQGPKACHRWPHTSGSARPQRQTSPWETLSPTSFQARASLLQASESRWIQKSSSVPLA